MTLEWLARAGFFLVGLLMTVTSLGFLVTGTAWSSLGDPIPRRKDPLTYWPVVLGMGAIGVWLIMLAVRGLDYP